MLPKFSTGLINTPYFPLRIEEYNTNGTLTYVEDRTAHMVNPDSGDRGYGAQIFLSWDIPQT